MEVSVHKLSVEVKQCKSTIVKYLRVRQLWVTRITSRIDVVALLCC